MLTENTPLDWPTHNHLPLYIEHQRKYVSEQDEVKAYEKLFEACSAAEAVVDAAEQSVWAKKNKEVQLEKQAKEKELDELLSSMLSQLS